MSRILHLNLHREWLAAIASETITLPASRPLGVRPPFAVASC